ncbi:alpha/beta hydrolase [Planctomicrobium sp. SH661]|uniref:alpha/beta hydrolase n=1 Tax=Planctomicrobium sp. SH661 TaxID=3448124 RepID=UPI003F5C6920
MRLIVFLLRVLFFSVIALPVIADDAAYFPQAETVVVNKTAAATDALLIPAAPERVPVESVAETLAPVAAPETCCANYWMVSSRYSVQNVHERCRGPWGLNVQELHCDGTSRNSNVTELSSQLVPGVPVCIFVHGSFVELPNQYVEAAGFYSCVRSRNAAPLQMIFFTWPSDGPYTGCFPLDVAVRGRQADFNGFHLAYLISQIPASCPVCLVGHSHGTRVILSGMHLVGGGTIEGYSFPYSTGEGRRYRVILAAGAMDHNWLNPGQPFACALNPVECLLNLQNRHDLALAALPLSRPFGRRAVARSGFTSHDVRALGGNAAKLRDCDVTDLVGHKHYWPYYYRQPAVIGAMLPYIYFQ